MNDKNYCPRCGNHSVINYMDTFECPRCRLEFLNDSLRNFEPENILSIQEITAFLKIIKDPETDFLSEVKGLKMSILFFFFKTKFQSLISLLLVLLLVLFPIFSL